jgi:uncharacterized protein YkwD
MTHLRPQIVAAAPIPPTENNAVGARWTRGRRPPRGRLIGLAVLMALCVATSPAAPNAETPTTVLRPLERSILMKVNAVRRDHGLVPLRFSAGLTAAARHHSTEMATRGYFGHRSAGGQAFDRRIARFYPISGRRYWSVGENLLWSSRELSAAAALDIWLNSRKHRTTMLSAHWRDVGVGAVHVVSAPGVYRGHEVTIVTADFGVRR